MSKKHHQTSHRPARVKNKEKREPQPETKHSRRKRRLQEKAQGEEDRKIRDQALRQGLTPIDRTKLVSSSVMPISQVPRFHGLYYLDYEFTCKDCGIRQVWTGRQQKWWHEVIGGDIEQIAVRCRDCRIKESARKTEARRVHLEGVEKKRIAQMGLEASEE